MQLSATDKSHSLTLAEWKSDQPKAPSGAPLHRAVNQPDCPYLARATRAVRGAGRRQCDAGHSQCGSYCSCNTAVKIVTLHRSSCACCQAHQERRRDISGLADSGYYSGTHSCFAHRHCALSLPTARYRACATRVNPSFHRTPGVECNHVVCLSADCTQHGVCVWPRDTGET